MSHQLEPPRIAATVLDNNTHRIDVSDGVGNDVTGMPLGASVLEVWVAHVPAGVPVERAYASFSWMKPATSVPVMVSVPSVTGRDPERGFPGRWHLFYKARWVRDGSAVSAWSNVAVAGDEEAAPPEAGANIVGGRRPV